MGEGGGRERELVAHKMFFCWTFSLKAFENFKHFAIKITSNQSFEMKKGAFN